MSAGPRRPPQEPPCAHPPDALDWFDKTLSFRVPATSDAAFAVCCRACGAVVRTKEQR